MTESERKFQEILLKKSRRDKLLAKLEELKAQKSDLTQKSSDLQRTLEKENADVARLETKTISSFLLSIAGKKVEKLNKERNEAYAAKLKYENALRELDTVENEINNCNSELTSLRGCDNEYKRAYNERLEELKSSGGEKGEEILSLEKEITELDHRKKETEEAKSVAERALYIAEDIVDSLKKAKNWSTYDLWGGGMFADLSKHEHLDHAQDLAESLQDQLRNLKTELSDIKIDADLTIRIDGFMRFADYFFDDFFSDIAVNDSICTSLYHAENTEKQIRDVLAKLNEILANSKRNKDLKETRIQSIVSKIS